ncbi:uncharacterized protein [Paramisgurnus dabryanus]|uniref:uncharacterized protein n=1 Tax=Paramisgurnus dabryanus TaxID=90735 RepID=UPI0031F3980E
MFEVNNFHKMFYTSLVLCLWTLLGVFGDEVKSVKQGDSVTLHTDITEIQTEDEIEWWFEMIRIARIKRSRNINPTYEDKNNKTQIFKDRLKMNNQTGDLTIINITTQHTGLYQLYINIGNQETVKRFNVTVYVSSTVSITESTQNPSNPSVTSEDLYTSSGGLQSDHIVVISISCCVAVGCLMIVASVVIFWIYRKHKNKHQQDRTRKDEDTYADTTTHKLITQTKKI